MCVIFKKNNNTNRWQIALVYVELGTLRNAVIRNFPPSHHSVVVYFYLTSLHQVLCCLFIYQLGIQISIPDTTSVQDIISV